MEVIAITLALRTGIRFKMQHNLLVHLPVVIVSNDCNVPDAVKRSILPADVFSVGGVWENSAATRRKCKLPYVTHLLLKYKPPGSWFVLTFRVWRRVWYMMGS